MTERPGPAAEEGLTFAPIVVGVDPADTTRNVVLRAAELAELLGARVHVVSAAYRPQGGRRPDGAQDEEISGDARADPGLCQALSAAAALFRQRDVEATLHAEGGDPAEAIVTVAEKERAGLIIVGNRGMRGARRYLLGDVPNKVAHHAPCRVMILKTTERYSERGTMLLGGLALAGLGTIAVGELARLRRRGSGAAARESFDVALAGYRSGSTGERALLLLFASFVITSGVTRWNTWSLRHGGRFALLPEMVRGHRHIHHFVPGIVAAFVSGAGAMVVDERHREWLAVPFGIGVALTVDEWALLLELADVYWSEEGIVSLQVTLGITALLATIMLAQRLLLRGERKVLPIGMGRPKAASAGSRARPPRWARSARRRTRRSARPSWRLTD
jgi:nucleotide-binding universal stress UspA family protein